MSVGVKRAIEPVEREALSEVFGFQKPVRGVVVGLFSTGGA